MEYRMEQDLRELEELDNALREAYQLCYDVPKFRVGVYVSSIRRQSGKIINRIVAAVVDNLPRIEFEWRWIWNNRNGSYEIRFPNGSLIQAVLGSHNSRAYKFHYIICDKTIEREIRDCVVFPSLMPRFKGLETIWSDMKYIECVI